MGLPVNVNLTAYRGDSSWSQTFRLLRGDVALDLTGASVEAEARSHRGEVHSLHVDTGEGDGTIVLRMPDQSLPPETYDYDVEVTEQGGAVTTWVRGLLSVSRDVTNELP